MQEHISTLTTADAVQPSDKGVKLLWTGGWDSTFQLLRLLLHYRAHVIPYYLKDATRPSTETELRAIQRIRHALREGFPETRALLRPLRVFDVGALAPDPEMDEALRTVRTHTYLGSQYAWLAAFCRQAGVDDIELSVHVDDKVQDLLRSHVVSFERPRGYRSFRVDPVLAGADEYALFRHYSFPLFRMDKLAMGREAATEGWTQLMEMTWFCHKPWRGKPCGLCPPCVYTIEEGLARRIPPTRRALSWGYRKTLLPVKSSLRSLRTALKR